MSDGPKADRKTIAIPNLIRDAMIVPNTRVPLPTAKNTFTVSRYRRGDRNTVRDRDAHSSR